jgi:hypothetical protein
MLRYTSLVLEWPITEAKQHWPRLVLGWVTVWEHHVPLAFNTGREADHSPPSSAEVKEWVELYFHSPNTPSWRGAQGEHRDNFTFTFVVEWILRS